MVIGILYPTISEENRHEESIITFARDFAFAFRQSGIFSKCYVFVLPEMKKSVMQQLNCNTKENRISVESIAEFIGSAADFDIDILYDMSSVHMQQHLYSLKHILNVENTPVLIKLLWPSELGQLSLQLSSSLPTKFQYYSYFVCLNMGQKRRVDWLLEKNEQQRFHPQSVYIPQGINLEIYRKRNKEEVRYHLQIPHDAKVILSLAGFSPHHNMDLIPLIRCFEELSNNRQDVMLILGGRAAKNGYASQIKKFLSLKPMCKKIWLMENLDGFTIPLLYAAADIFVSPSDTLQQLTCSTVLEAMASELPVVISDWLGYKDIVQHGRTGYKVPIVSMSSWSEIEKYFSLLPSKHVEFFISQSIAIDLGKMRFYLEQLLADENLRESMGRSARRFVSANHHWSRIIQQHEDLFKIAIAEARCPLGQIEGKSYPILTNSLLIPTIGQNMFIRRNVYGEKALESMEIHGYPEMDGILYYPIVFEILNLTSSWIKVVEIIDYLDGISDSSKSFRSEILYHISWMIKQGFVNVQSNSMT